MSLIKRLETADHGSRELDDAILEHLGFERIENPKMPGQWFWKGVKIRVTTDLSAAVALVERVLPEWEWEINNHYGCSVCHPDDTCNFDHDPTTRKYGCASPVSQALGLCIALLKALEAKEAP